MGKGSYLGGHSIINTNRKSPEQLKKEKVKREKAKRNLLNVIIDAELDGRNLSKVSRTYKSFYKTISSRGGPHEWAKAQVDYQKLKARKIKRRNKQQSTESIDANQTI